MTIAINEIQRVFRYHGVVLPDVPGMTPREVRDLYSAQYPELISAEIEAGKRPPTHRPTDTAGFRWAPEIGPMA